MKKLLSLILCMAVMLTSFTAIASDPYVNLNSLKYNEYMRGESITVSGKTNMFGTLGLYYPEEAGGSLKFAVTYSPTELLNGIVISTDADDADSWPYGTWTIIVQNGDISDSVEFDLVEVADRSESSRPNTGDSTVTPINVDKTELTITAGKSETVEVTTAASSLTIEVEDEDVVSASLSGKTLTVKALKRGESAIWIKTSNNYISINVTVKAKSTGGTGSTSGTEKETEPTEPVTEPTEEPTDEPTDEPTEEPTTAPVTNPFEDVENHWAKDSIVSLYSRGIINGMDNDTFAPDEGVTRAQFVTMLYKAFALKAHTTASPFNDVSTDDWYFNAIMAAYDSAVTKGDPSGNFNPNALVTRQDMAVFAYRAVSSLPVTAYVITSTLFDDHASISDYAVEAVYSMRAKGVINGMTNTTFDPRSTATRAQAAHIIYKLLEL